MTALIPKWTWITSGMLIALSLVPSLELRMTLSGTLALPFRWLYSPPLVCSDKPWQLTYLGGVVTAVAWSCCLMMIAVVLSFSKRKPKSAP